MNLIKLHRVGSLIHRKGLHRTAKVFYYINFLLFNSSVPMSVQIGQGSKFAYGGIGVVINGKARIGRDCMIGQGITIGGRGPDRPGSCMIGDNVYISAGVRILGPVIIGDYAIIAPNAVVLHDVPAGTIVGGIPAKVLRSGIDSSNHKMFV